MAGKYPAGGLVPGGHRLHRFVLQSLAHLAGRHDEGVPARGRLAGAGFAINVPDFDGKFNTFNTYAEGKMVLDSLRAVKNDEGLGLADPGIALYGYSGGGSGSMRAAEPRGPTRPTYGCWARPRAPPQAASPASHDMQCSRTPDSREPEFHHVARVRSLGTGIPGRVPA